MVERGPIRILDLLKILLASVLLSATSPAFGQAGAADSGLSSQAVTDTPKAVTEAPKEQLWALVDRIFRALSPEQRSRSASLSLLTDVKCDVTSPEFLRADAYRKASERLDSDPGLRFGAFYSAGQQVGAASNEPAVGQDGYVELAWDTLRGGYLDSQDQAEAAALRAKRARLQGLIADRRRELKCARHQLSDHFASLRSKLLTLKKELMEPAYQIERRAYFKGWSHLDDLMVSESDLVRLREQLSQLHGKTSARASALEKPLPGPAVFDVDMQAVAARIEADQRDNDIARIERNLRRLDHNERQKRLSFFVRQNIDENNDTSVSLGARFSMPLFTHQSERDEELDLWLNSIDADHEMQDWERVTQARSAYLEVSDQLDQVIQQHYRYSRAYERTRRSIAEHDLSTANADLPLAITRARSLLDAATEMAEAKESLYRNILKVFTAADIAVLPSALKSVSLPDRDNRRRPGQRQVYVWSETFNAHPNRLLLAFLEAKGINRVAVSGGKDIAPMKFQRFIRKAENSGILISVIKGDPRWALRDRHESAVSQIRRAADATGSVHVDVEPHTLDRFDTQSEQLLDGYLGLINRLNSKLEMDQRLTVAVPMHWPLEVYEKLSYKVDATYIMAYGEPRAKHLLKRLKPIIARLPRDRVRLILRASDFSDEWQLEQTLQTLQKRTSVDAVGVHDLADYMKLSGDE